LSFALLTRTLNFLNLSGAKPHGRKTARAGTFTRNWSTRFIKKRVGSELKKEDVMSLGTILIILLILALIGVLPTWGYSNSWGYGPGGIVGLLLVIIIILALLGRL